MAATPVPKHKHKLVKEEYYLNETA